ncbi:MAG: NnrS family protein, partial [Gallionellaceae bacterium]
MKNILKTWKIFTAAPHRVMFFGGALQIIAVMLWWLIDMVGRFGVAGHPIMWSILPNAAHIYLMVFGLFPSFIFGFVMTTFPRWMGGREISAAYYVTTFLFMLLGNVIFYIGLLTQQSILLLAVYSTLVGWAVGNYALLRVILDTKPSNKRNPVVIIIVLSLGWLGLLAYSIWLLNGNMLWLQIATQTGIWLFLLPL